MKTFFEIREGSVTKSDSDTANILVYALPDDSEKRELLQRLRLDQHTLDSALDPDEISRVEFAPDYASIIWKRPNTASFEEQLRFEVSSVGLFLQTDRLTLVLGESTFPFGAKEFHGVASVMDVALKFLLHTIHHYFEHLKVIKQLTRDLQSKLNLSMENQYFLQMFSLGESLVYYLNALEANASVLTKLRANADRVGFSKAELEMVDDIIIEHQQCCKQTSIYSSVLSGLMDARGNIINNNMNVLLKNLTLINVVFLPLNLIASIGGMSEFSMMTSGLNWKAAYSMFMLGMVLLGWMTWIFLVRKIDRGPLYGRRKGRRPGG